MKIQLIQTGLNQTITATWSHISVKSVTESSVPYTTRSSADVDKPARRVYRSVKVTKHGTIRYVRYGFLSVCYSNFVPKTVWNSLDVHTRSVDTFLTFKNRLKTELFKSCYV